MNLTNTEDNYGETMKNDLENSAALDIGFHVEPESIASKLSDFEFKLLILMAKEKGYHYIFSETGVGPRSLEMHKRLILKKLGHKNMFEVTRILNSENLLNGD